MLDVVQVLSEDAVGWSPLDPGFRASIEASPKSVPQFEALCPSRYD
jgi:hypothetical protein